MIFEMFDIASSLIGVGVALWSFVAFSSDEARNREREEAAWTALSASFVILAAEFRKSRTEEQG